MDARWLIGIGIIIASLLAKWASSQQQQSLGAGLFGQLSMPDYSGQPLRPRPLSYANTLWPFPAAYPPAADGYGGARSPPLSAPYLQPQLYGGWPQPQQQQPVQLNDLIAQLSVALVRSFAQMLAEREMSRGAGGGPYQNNGGGGTGNLFGLPLSLGQPHNQPPLSAPPSFPARTSSNYGYGVNAGVFAGTYGNSDSIAGPLGPYGPLNSQIGGSPYSGLSPWPFIPGRPGPQQPSANTNSSSRPASQQGGGQPPQQGQVVGQGTVVQIPLTENVQGGEGGQPQQEGSGAGEQT